MRAPPLLLLAASCALAACDKNPTADYFQIDVKSHAPLATQFPAKVSDDNQGASIPAGIAVALELSGKSGGQPMKDAWLSCGDGSAVGVSGVTKTTWIVWGASVGRAVCQLNGIDSNGKKIDALNFTIDVADQAPPAAPDAAAPPPDASSD